jgi:hypothetical protein
MLPSLPDEKALERLNADERQVFEALRIAQGIYEGYVRLAEASASVAADLDIRMSPPSLRAPLTLVIKTR